MTRPIDASRLKSPIAPPHRNSKEGQIARRTDLSGTPLSWFSNKLIDTPPQKSAHKQNDAPHAAAPIIAQKVPNLNSLVEFPKLA